ncbi:multiple epidermal growth factor-like domains protein 10 [Mizuhopecten yessoensis]|uniref:multiple epidermal growth factor-like domains protein 10 n=1 Tax=Mizuhopecten yessoensis TaxID=6573 RepID=UPI000B45E584|nr:multiple epidermal growth factor-like domains protein 10 [Mizuhopecten yessoensis]
MELVKLEIIGYFMTLLVLCFGPCFVKSSRDLARNKTATQSSTYSDTQSYDAGRAVDGVLGIDVGGGHCSHTGTRHHHAWWKVDLGDVYRIQMINITYRYSQTTRLKGYSIYVTNNTDMTQAIGSISKQSGHLCYHDTESGTPTYNQSRECHVTGRYVVFYNTRPNETAYIELCDDLAYRKITLQSTTNGVFSSGKAVDGVITADVSDDGSCSHTKPTGNHPEAWWQVDLGQIERIQTINIIYRQLYPFRMSGFYLYVSNSSYTNSQSLSRDYLCYHDHGPGLPSYIQSLPCSIHGRYVTFYNKRPADYEPRNVTYYSETTAIISLCEVQVLGGCSAGLKGDSCNEDCEHGLFGQGCSQTCHCATADCNKRTGTCGPQGCSAGWKGLTCSQACDTGTFGQNCHQQCHCSKQDCDKKLGRCTGECLAGWQGDSCNQACDHGTFGQNCTQQCHCSKQDCDKQTGGCTGGCLAGWQGDSCNQACDPGTFGQNCTQQCHCSKQDCDKQTGGCTGGCLAGWQGDSCNQACDPGTFGQNCTQQCHCSKQDCDKQTGGCTGGCLAGWQGDSCNQACDPGTFGQNCTQQCHCSKQDCDKQTGGCTGGCLAGWQGDSCNQACDPGTFGQNCTQQCHCSKLDCDKQTGGCTGGCLTGWQGDSCNKVCDPGTFGRNCIQQCHCSKQDCNKQIGCTGGCFAGWHGDSCNQGNTDMVPAENKRQH